MGSGEAPCIDRRFDNAFLEETLLSVDSTVSCSTMKAAKRMSGLLENEKVKSWRLLMAAFQRVYQSLEQGLAQEQCTISRFQILLHLYFDGPLPAAEIAKRLFVTRGNMSMFLRRLQSEGLISVAKESPSAKRPYFRLTARGVEFFEDIFPRHIERVKKLMPTLGRGTRRELEGVISGEARA